MGTAAVSSGAMEAGGGGPGAAAPSRSAAPGHEPGAAASSPRPRKKRRKCSIPSINLTSCKYESVRRAALCCGLKEVGENEDWTVYWTDYSVSLERVMEMKRFQKINHFPGMIEICRKDLLARNLNRMLKLFPKEYNIFPRTWSLPADYGDFQAYRRRRKNRTFICKPDSGCQGRGIFITRNPEEIKHGEHMICQQYISKVNHSPSFTTDSHLDHEVKDALLFDTINLINVHACNKRKMMEEDKQRAKERLLQAHRTPHVSRHEESESSQAAWLSEAEDYENSHLGSYRRIYPACGTDKYEPFFKQSSSLFKETVSSKAREECTRQQLEEIRTKKEKLEAANSKKKKERKERLQGESATDKSTVYNKTPASATHLTYRSRKMCEKKTEHVQYDSMQPQDILENEEKKRVNALARRKNLIQGLGIVDQLSRLLPTTERSSDTHRACTVTSEIQTQFLWDTLQAQQPGPLMTIIPLSFPRGTAWPSGQPSAHKHSTRAQLQAGQHPALETLLVRGQSIPFQEQHTVQCSPQPQDRGYPWSQAAEPAAVTQPCTKIRGRPMSAWQLSAARNKAEGCDIRRPLCLCSAHPGSLGCLARAGKAMGDGSFSGVTAQQFFVASASLMLHTRATHCASAMNFRDVSTGHGGGGRRRGCGGSWARGAAPPSGR
eukprot:XP_015147678.1 tubulin polyglutamylase TTLL6 isoform X6 [Gallus gallus]